MSIWYLCPSARPVEEASACLKAWLEFGCEVMVLRQGPKLWIPKVVEYPATFYAGWGISNNRLLQTVRQIDVRASWFIFGGDDYWPDPCWSAEEVRVTTESHFGGTLGVMQPTGDRYGDGYIDTAAASPWVGLEFAQRAYEGHGPFCAEYHHFYADTELQDVATALECFWQRPDIKQEHKHWSRYGIAKPDFADELYTAYWEKDEALYRYRKAAGFTGHRLLSKGSL